MAIEKAGHIRNPLTVIAMFAGLAEVSGTIVLPMLERSTQTVFVWFLMLFPVLLVSAFFGTLIGKHHVLYAPSDFKDETLFANLFTKASISALEKKIEAETSIEDGSPLISAGPAEPLPPAVIAPSVDAVDAVVVKAGAASSYKDDYRRTALRMEALAIPDLERRLGISLQRTVSPKDMSGVVFDAVGRDGDRNVVVEVRYTRVGRFTSSTLIAVFERVDRFWASLPVDIRLKFTFLYFVVTDQSADSRALSIRSQIDGVAARYNFKTRIIITKRVKLEERSSKLP